MNLYRDNAARAKEATETVVEWQRTTSEAMKARGISHEVATLEPADLDLLLPEMGVRLHAQESSDNDYMEITFPDNLFSEGAGEWVYPQQTSPALSQDNPTTAKRTTIANALLKIEEVDSVRFTKYQIRVKKKAGSDWDRGTREKILSIVDSNIDTNPAPAGK